MSDEHMDEHLSALRDGYNAPPETPREDMWAVIRAGLPIGRGGTADAGESVVSLDRARETRRPASTRWVGWAVAAGAVLMMGVGIGRMTAPSPPLAPSLAAGGSEVTADRSVLRAAAVEHLGRSESFLTLVRAEARAGALDPEVAAWAEGLLTQTRLFLDASDGQDPAFQALMEDLELVLAQIVGVAENGTDDPARTRTELDLALRGLEEGEVMTRIQAVSGPTLAGT